MAIYIGNQKIKEIYQGNVKMKEAYKGGQLIYSAVDTRGYWVHKNTGVKTYFNLSASFISNGIMSRPTWMGDAKEVKLCAGITGFHIKSYSVPPYTVEYSNVFWQEDVDITSEMYKNTILEVLDMSLTSVTELPSTLISAFSVDENTGKYIPSPFTQLVLPPTLISIIRSAINIFAENSATIKGFTNALAEIGGVQPWGSQEAGIMLLDDNTHIFVTETSNVPHLTNLIDTENAAGRGVSGNYQIIGE